MGTRNILGQGEDEKQNKTKRSRELKSLDYLNLNLKMISKMNVCMLVVLVVVSLMSVCEAKPQCGLRWRGPCRRSFKRGNDAYDAFVAEKVASELEDNSANQMKDEDLNSLETELLDIIKKSKAVKRFAE